MQRADTRKVVFTAELIGKVYVLVIIDGVLQQQKQHENKHSNKAGSQSGGQAMQAAAAPAPNASGETAKQVSSSGSKATQSPAELWHSRLGHVSMLRVEELSQSGAVVGMPRMLLEKPGLAGESAEVACGPCALGKKHRHTFKTQRSDLYQRATKPGERLFSDLSGRISLDLAEGVTHLLQSTVCPSEYLSVTVDEATGLYFAWGLQYKSDASDRLMKWLRQLMKEKGSGVPKEVVTDGGGEYGETTLKEFFAKHGILHKPTQDHTQQHNGHAERAMRTIFEMARCMLQAAKLPPVFWLLACVAAVWIINRTRLVKLLPKGGQQAASGAAAAAGAAKGVPQLTMVTAYEAFTGQRPSLKHVRQFGCDAYVHVPDAKRSKLDPKALECIHVGYAPYKPGTWRVLVLSSGKVIESRDVSFAEGQFTFRGERLQQAMGWKGHIDTEEDREALVDSMQFDKDTQRAIKISLREAQAERRKQQLNPPEEQEEQKQPAAVVQAAGQGVSAQSPSAVEASRSTSSVASKPGVQVQTPAAAPKPAETTQVQGSTAAEAPAQAASSSSSSSSSSSDSNSDTRRSTRARRGAAPNYTGEKVIPMAHAAQVTAEHTQAAHKVTAHALAAAVQEASETDGSDPASYREMLERPASEGWHGACAEEMAAHERNGTWELVDAPAGANVIGNKWVLRTKYKQSVSTAAVEGPGVREVLRRKARLTAKGCGQKEGVDYSETYAPTLKYVTLRVMLALGCVLHLLLKQLDVTTAYLQAPMHEKVYMRQPEGFVDPQRPHAVCLLKKSLYGTKQAGHNWNNEVNSFITGVLGYTRTVSDPCLYWRRSATGQLMLLGIFVDDILHEHAAADDAEWCSLKATFVSRFPSTDGGDVDVLLGMRITRNIHAGWLTIDQEAYVKQIIKQWGMEQCKQVSTPAQPGVRLSQKQSSEAAADARAAAAVPAAGRQPAVCGHHHPRRYHACSGPADALHVEPR